MGEVPFCPATKDRPPRQAHAAQRKNTYLRFHIIRWKTIIKDPHGLIDTNARFVCREIIIMAGSVILLFYLANSRFCVVCSGEVGSYNSVRFQI